MLLMAGRHLFIAPELECVLLLWSDQWRVLLSTEVEVERALLSPCANVIMCQHERDVRYALYNSILTCFYR